MTLFGTIGFSAPWLLLGLLALPILWVLLRAIPPAPVRRMFPGVVLLLGLRDDDQISDRTPWWLLLLRMLAVAAVIIGLAGPILGPQGAAKQSSDRPLLVVMDGSWASARDWAQRLEFLDTQLDEAARQARPVALLNLSAPQPATMQTAEAVRTRVMGVDPSAWEPSSLIEGLLPEGGFDTLWLSDGLARPSRDGALALLEDRGSVTVFESARPLLALGPSATVDGVISLPVMRKDPASDDAMVLVQGTDPAGQAATLAQGPVQFDRDALTASAEFDLPPEMRARITHFELQGQRTAGAVSLADDSLRRREVALIAGRDDREGLELLSPLHYLHKALEPTADLLDGALLDVIPANPDVIILADVATVTAAEELALVDWIETGGLLLRFAGPRLAASDVSRDAEDRLMPVRLRAGGRTVGGAMSWGEPKALAPFTADSPFFGLPVPDDVRVSAQVMAQPDPTLAERVIAQLTDGTPLVTRKPLGQGQVVLVHVTANAEWSSLALSGLFVQMLDRLAASSAAVSSDSEDLAGTIWAPVRVLDGFGRFADAGTLPGIAGERLFEDPLGPDLRPGLYQSEGRSAARNVLTADATLTPAVWPSSVTVRGMTRSQAMPLAGWLLGLAIALLLADVLASLALTGRLMPMKRAAVMLAGLMLLPQDGSAQSDEAALVFTSELRLAYVVTGDADQDRLSEAGLHGLSETLFFRTSVEPDAPVGVDLERDELAFFPLLYWPITTSQPTPSAEAYEKLNAFIRSGGMILFDTRDADIARFGGASPEGRKLQQLAAPLAIPALEPIPQDHVLTRTFYLVQDFPGRHAQGTIWVEAAPPDAEQIEGMPFRNLNDNVTPVVIGGNDWAAAWAMDERGNPLVPIGRGMAGERQREISLRFGVNLVMHVLTGNYKSDQVHVPALLERLGQ